MDVSVEGGEVRQTPRKCVDITEGAPPTVGGGKSKRKKKEKKETKNKEEQENLSTKMGFGSASGWNPPFLSPPKRRMRERLANVRHQRTSRARMNLLPAACFGVLGTG